MSLGPSLGASTVREPIEVLHLGSTMAAYMLTCRSVSLGVPGLGMWYLYANLKKYHPKCPKAQLELLLCYHKGMLEESLGSARDVSMLTYSSVTRNAPVLN